MKRKLVKQAGQALTLTLPITWIRNHDLSAGDEVDVVVDDKTLFIKTDNSLSSTSLDLDLTGLPVSSRHWYINAAYAKGVDEINVSCESDYYPDLSSNIGFAVVSQTKSGLVIKDISGGSGSDLDQVFKQVFQMIIRFYNQAIVAIYSKDKSSLSFIMNQEDGINKFILFLQRSIMKQSYSNASLGKVLFSFSYSLEKVGDEIFRLWRTDIQKKISKSGELKSILDDVAKGLELSFGLYYHFSSKDHQKLFTLRNSIRKKISSLKRVNSSTRDFLRHVQNIIEDVNDLSHLSLMKSN